MSNPFQRPEFDKTLDPVTYFNLHRTWADAFSAGGKNIRFVSETEIIFETQQGPQPGIIVSHEITPPPNNLAGLHNKPHSRFMIFNLLRFKGDYRAAISHIEWTWLNHKVPYIRVGTDYFCLFSKPDRYGINRTTIKPWKKEEIKSDHGPGALKVVHRYKDFIIHPDNIDYQQTVNECFNLYAPFPHTPYSGSVTAEDIPVTLNFLQHIFGDQFSQGMTYMKCLYEHPTLPLPVLCLVSAERQTGKTTFNNYINILFGDNFVLINPEDLVSSFNASYATKNIICIDETVIDKTHSIEKLKSIATAKTINVNQKHVSNYAVPFFGKVIISTNKEVDFIKIDQEEIRFWIRKIRTIANINTNIEQDLIAEIPKFLTYLLSLPAIDTSRSRMVLTADEIYNKELETVKEESQSSLYKELYILFSEFFNKEHLAEDCYCTPNDIKLRWFSNNHSVSASYIKKVIMYEFKLKNDLCRYVPFCGDPMTKVVGRPFRFERSMFDAIRDVSPVESEIPF